MPNSSSSAANVPGTGSPSIAMCAIVRLVEKPSAPASMPSRTMRAIASMSSAVAGSFLAPRSPITYAAHRAVRHLRADVEHLRRAVDRVEVLGEVLPLPLDALGERGAGDVFDAFHQADEPVVLVGLHRREADAAVAHHDRGDAVPARRREQRVPGDLAVEVRVHVDEAGRDERAVGVDRLARGAVDRADLGDDAVGDRDVGGARAARRCRRRPCRP